jgi:hypothetical protein
VLIRRRDAVARNGGGGLLRGAQLIPNGAKYAANWYVYEWSDTNGDPIANAGDGFTQVMAGP